MAITLDDLVTKIEAAIVANVAGAQLLKRLEPPSENPQQRAHKGVRVWPASTEVLEEFSSFTLNYYEDTVIVDLVYRVTRDVVASRTAAFQFEDSVIRSLGDRAWYGDVATWATTDQVEIHLGSRSREVEEGWITTSIEFRIRRQEALI